MSLSDERVREVAALAHLELGEGEVATLQHDLSQMLAYVEQLTEVDVTGVEATTHAVPLSLALRDDKTPPHTLSREAALQNAPERGEEGGGVFFAVPKVLDL